MIRGVSLKVQEEEREKRLEEAPEQSAVDISAVTVSAGTKAMLEYDPLISIIFKNK